MVRPWLGTAIRDGAMPGGTHLELEERERLAAPKAEGLSLRAIARALGRAASTISRELRRNALPKGGYLPVHAEGCYRERRQRPAVLERDPKLGRFVRERLLEGWTPERIAGWLERGEERGLGRVSVETIYAFIHRPRQKGEKLLPRGRCRRAQAGRGRGQRRRGPPAVRQGRPPGLRHHQPARGRALHDGRCLRGRASAASGEVLCERGAGRTWPGCTRPSSSASRALRNAPGSKRPCAPLTPSPSGARRSCS